MHPDTSNWTFPLGSVKCIKGKDNSLWFNVTQHRTTTELVYKPIRVTVTVCQEKIGESDCGLFAIANDLALAKGIPIQNIKFLQSHMRSHLHQCFQNQLLKMFSHETIENSAQSKTFIISR